MLSREEVLKISKLARLELTPAEIELYQTRLGRVLDYVKELSSLPTSNEDIVEHIPKDAASLREDVVEVFANNAGLMKNAPSSEAHQFILPPIVEQS